MGVEPIIPKGQAILSRLCIASSITRPNLFFPYLSRGKAFVNTFKDILILFPEIF